MKITGLKPLEEKLLRKPKIGPSVVKVKGGQVLNKQRTEGRSTRATFRMTQGGQKGNNGTEVWKRHSALKN